MLPKTHFILGAIFSILLYFIFHITAFQASLVFFASFLIDFDHYAWHVLRKKSFSLKKSYDFFNIKPYEKRMMLFHTLEFILLILILSYFWRKFLFIWIGMIFHSLLDIIQMGYDDELKYREFFLTNFLRNN